MSMRKRIGLMVPSTNTTCEADFQMVVPRGITVHGQRLWMTNEGTGDEIFNRMNAEIESGRPLSGHREGRRRSSTDARRAASSRGPAGTGRCAM